MTEEDTTAIPHALYPSDKPYPNLTPMGFGSSNFSRVIFRPVGTRCLFGYALSLRGAQRSLYFQSVGKRANPADKALNEFCESRSLGLKCFAPYPPIFGTHRAAGSANKDSDRLHGDATSIREIAVTDAIVHSTKINLQRLIAGEATVLSQWPNMTMFPEFDRSGWIPRGRGVFIKHEEFGP